MFSSEYHRSNGTIQEGNEESSKAKKMKTNARSQGERTTYTARVIEESEENGENGHGIALTVVGEGKKTRVRKHGHLS